MRGIDLEDRVLAARLLDPELRLVSGTKQRPPIVIRGSAIGPDRCRQPCRGARAAIQVHRAPAMRAVSSACEARVEGWTKRAQIVVSRDVPPAACANCASDMVAILARNRMPEWSHSRCAHPRPDTFALRTRQEHVEIEHALERPRAQIGAVEQDRHPTGFFPKPACGDGGLGAPAGRASRRCDRQACGGHGVTKVSSGPCSTR